MNKICLLSLALTISIISFGQNAEDLNKKSKELIDRRDFKNAIPLIQKAADLGNAEAQYNYGVCYQQGVEVTKNDSTANVWFLKSALNGWKDAQFKIAYSYATGRGLKQNYTKAFEWSLKCAEQNDPGCMFNVINCYLEGSGVNKNLDSMLIWAIRLGKLETPENLQLSGQITSARANLATMFRDGVNVKKDLVKSYTWFLLYNESKRDFSVIVQQENIDAIKKIEKGLTSSQKETAKIEAEKLLNRKLTNLANLYKQDL